MAQDEIFIEFRVSGNFIKVSAIDAKTGFETCIVGDARVGREQLKALAVKKLRYVMKRAEEQKDVPSKRGLLT